MIRIRNVAKTYRTRGRSVRALENISLDLPDRGFVALCGENGCGKTTLLNAISTLDPNFSGEITIDNLNVRKDKDVIRQKVLSYVFQQDCFVENLNVQQNLTLETEDEGQIQELLTTFRIAEKAGSLPKELSGGQSQRTSFIRGLLKQYDVLLVDEPTSSMDEDMETYVFQTLRALSKSKLVILVSHNMAMVNAYCDIIIRLNQGTLESIKNNTAADDIRYRENEVIFSNEINLKSADQKIVNDILDTYGSIVIKKETKGNGQAPLPYGGTHTYETKTVGESISGKRLGSMFRSSVSHWARLISVSLILCILILFGEILLDLKTFDADQFTIRTFQSNGEQFVSARYQQNYHVFNEDFDEDAYHFSKDDILFLRSTYGIRIDEVFGWRQSTDNYIAFPSAWDDDNFFTMAILGFCRSNLKSEQLLAGSLPTTYNEYLLTDYLADGLIRISSDTYSSYEDLMTKGIDYDGYLIHICGILDTDYEYYRNLSDDDWTDKETTNYSEAENNQYCRVYCPDVAPGAKELGLQYVIDGDFYTDIVSDDERSVEPGHCFINTAFAERFNYSGQKEFKLPIGYYSVDGVVEDDRCNPTLYVHEQDFADAVNELSDNSLMNIDISNPDVLHYLQKKDVNITSYTGTYIYKVINVIAILGRLFALLIAILTVILLIYLIHSIRAISKQNQYLYLFQKMFGLRRKYYIYAEFGTVLLCCLIAIAANGILYPLLYSGINSLLSGLFFTSVILLMNSISTYGIAAAVLLCAATVLYFICYCLREKKDLISFVKPSHA